MICVSENQEVIKVLSEKIEGKISSKKCLMLAILTLTLLIVSITKCSNMIGS